MSDLWTERGLFLCKSSVAKNKHCHCAGAVCALHPGNAENSLTSSSEVIRHETKGPKNADSQLTDRGREPLYETAAAPANCTLALGTEPTSELKVCV